MRETGPSEPFENVDSYIDMALRREINNFAAEPAALYGKGLELAQQYISLDEDSVLVDVGCSSGKFIIEAAQLAQIPSHLVGIDVQDEPYRQHLPASVDTTNFTFIQAAGERMPLQDNAADLVLGNNVLFRTDRFSLLEEMKRITRPDGLVVLSSNAKGHALWRHVFERLLAVSVSQKIRKPVGHMGVPASSIYLEGIPSLVRASGGLEVVDRFVQDTRAIITRDRLETYAYSLKLSANRLSGDIDTAEARRLWREQVDTWIVPFIEDHMKGPGFTNSYGQEVDEPYFADTVRRGLYILRNVKP